MLKLEIPPKIFQQMVAQARALAPIEACGILAGGNGKVEGAGTNVTEAPLRILDR